MLEIKIKTKNALARSLARPARSETALLYNDRAVLENFHISQAFSLMRQEECNILAGLSQDEYR